MNAKKYRLQNKTSSNKIQEDSEYYGIIKNRRKTEQNNKGDF